MNLKKIQLLENFEQLPVMASLMKQIFTIWMLLYLRAIVLIQIAPPNSAFGQHEHSKNI